MFPKLRPYLNKAHFSLFDGVCSTEFHVLTSKDEDFLRTRFLSVFLGLPVVVSQTKWLMTGNTLPRLQTEDIRALEIPIPSMEVQNEVVAIMDDAYAAKKSKEEEAQALLDSVDDYLLGELGINLPKESLNTLKDRMFVRPASSLVGTRWDAFYFQQKFYALMETLGQSLFVVVPLKQELVQLYNGFDDRQTVEFGSPYLKVANIRPYEINPTEGQCITSDVPERVKLQSGDILLTRKGTFGVAVRVAGAYESCTICSEIFKLRFSSKVHPEYMEAVLNSSICQRQFDRIKIGAIMGSLTQEAVLQVQVPLPPLEKQQAIAEQIASIRAQAKRLQEEAAAGLEQAKAEVEKLILGA